MAQGGAFAKRRLSSATDYVAAAFVLPYCYSSAAGAAFDKPQRGRPRGQLSTLGRIVICLV